MAEMLTAKEMQVLLQVDRSTIYRMAEAGDLPAIKVGKQWRFPGDRVQHWLKTQTGSPMPVSAPAGSGSDSSFTTMLPLDCIQLIQDAFAEVLGVMLVVTDLAGQPVTRVSCSCPVYNLLVETGHDDLTCHQKWHELGQVPALEPRFAPGFGGVLCARALIRLGNELKGMVIVSGVAPVDWPPAPSITAELAQSLQITPEVLQNAFASVPSLTLEEQKKVLTTTQRIADILAHITSERYSFLERLDSIAKLSAL